RICNISQGANGQNLEFAGICVGIVDKELFSRSAPIDRGILKRGDTFTLMPAPKDLPSRERLHRSRNDRNLGIAGPLPSGARNSCAEQSISVDGGYTFQTKL